MSSEVAVISASPQRAEVCIGEYWITFVREHQVKSHDGFRNPYSRGRNKRWSKAVAVKKERHSKASPSILCDIFVPQDIFETARRYALTAMDSADREVVCR